MSPRQSRDPDRLISRAGIAGDPRQDQHFLIDDRVLDRIAAYASEVAGPIETVLEVGAGTGALTDRLLHTADRVIAVERDRRLVDFITREFADEIERGDLTVIEGDVLEVDLPTVDAVVANLPYGVASQVLFRCLPWRMPMVLMVQCEFADRLVAEPGTADYGRLTVTAGHFAAVRLLEPVPATAFDPAPTVESAIVAFEPREPAYEVHDEARLMELIRALFTQRRKTLRNAIRNTTHLSGIERPDEVVRSLPEGWADRRPGTLSPSAFARLAAIVAEIEAEP